MAKQTEDRNEAISQLWKQLDESRISMLSVRASDQHPQPMTHYADRESGLIWFITASDTDLAGAIGDQAEAQLVLMSPDQDYQASIYGQISCVDDEEKLDELWSPFAAAWFEEGRNDPKIRLMKMEPSEAAIWASESNSILVGLKIMRAGLSDDHSHPNVGVHHIVEFDKAA
ncbi:pyridoxamine 5'-phosphate oxidase family protein [Yoonia litorea]|uniref:General stress protein 26 n=1 Tax=Yoonia litorea TaxID=1123755 RepID=A0A1I6MZU9_9RHOB|nr:pyridoxamine 5'-phosphate oxidase family protein [Yoonia litorea]SFS21235.1 General stress protein 26 [Yoonia litorea]